MASPNALLNTMRQLVAQINNAQRRDAHVSTALADDLAFICEALDDQLSAGMSLPTEWNVRPLRQADVEGWTMDRKEFRRLGKRFTRLIPDYDRGRALRRHKKVPS